MGSLRTMGVLVLVLLICLLGSIRAEGNKGLVVEVSDVAISVVDNDGFGPKETLSFSERQSTKLSASHLHKLKLSFELKTPDGALFHAHQAFLRLQLGNFEHLFLVKPTKKRYQLTLDFLGLVEQFQYVGGHYTMDLIVGDPKMANSFLWNLGILELDLPEPPADKKAQVAEIDISAIYGPKPEIEHIFRAPEKRPPAAVSYTFLGLTLLPFIGFLVGLRLLNINMANLPTSGTPALSAMAFHAGLASILGLYVLFWIKLNLFTTLQILGFLGLLTTVAGYGILSHLADVSYKVKVA